MKSLILWREKSAVASALASSGELCDANAVDLHSDPPATFCLNEYVRLTSLKAIAFNGEIGMVVNFDAASDRYGVVLHGESFPKAFKERNLVRYVHDRSDLCGSCNTGINLNAFPPCDCETPTRTPVASSELA